MQRRRNKVKDKPPPEPHREYLDAESSDEAERRDEARETEEAEISMVPQYTEDELNELVQCVKDMTTLSGLRSVDWTGKCDMDIREYFQNPRLLILCVYHVYGSPTTEFSFPAVAVRELNYFARRPDEVFRAESFRERVLFGSVNDNVESHVLAVVQNVLAPIFFTIETWPDSVKADFAGKLDTFLCALTDLTYKMLGLTVIYVPLESRELTAEEGSADKELVKRLEGIVVHWGTQIKIALSDQEQASRRELLCIDDEYDFWTYRYDNLCSLNYQLQLDMVQRIIEILVGAHSTYIRQFQALRDEIEHGTVEASSNIEYLSILRGTCDELKACATPACVAQYLSRMMHLFRTIWLNSPHYNTRERIGNLFGAFSNQIIVMCKDFIDLEEMFAGSTRKSMSVLEECISLCEEYKTVYHKIMNAHINLTRHPWDLDAENIFRYVDVFIGRCQDMIEICHAMIDFARSKMDDTVEISSPKFSGTNGEEHERVCQKIERLFREALSKIEANSHKIFAVHDATWQDNMLAFRAETRDLEIMIENLIATVFSDVNNVQQGVQDLCSFYNYLNRENLKSLFESKNASVWKIFADDIQQTKQEVLNERDEYPSITPYYAGRALNLRLKGDRLLSTRKMLEEAEWMPYCGMSEEIYHQQNIVIRSIEDSTKNLYAKWLRDVGENPRARLDRFLMRRGDGKSGLLECNIDPSILNLCHESSYWISLRFPVPVHIQIIYDKWKTLNFVYESVCAVALAYNRIIAALSLTERALFRELIRQLDRKINPGLTKLTWNTDYVDSYIEDCFNETTSFQEFIDTYKHANSEIVRISESICDTPMIRIRVNYTYTLPALEEELLHVRSNLLNFLSRDEAFQVMTRRLDVIFLHVMEIYEGFKDAMEVSHAEWQDYLTKIDAMIEEAIRLCLQSSLTIMLEALHGTGATGPSPLLLVQADIIDNKINFVPSLLEIATLIGDITNILLEPLWDVTLLAKKFKIQYESPSLSELHKQDKELIGLQQKLNNEVSYCFAQMQNYLKTWEPFKEIWEVNKDLFIQRYEKLKPTALSFDADISKYYDVINSVQLQETVSTVHFVDINSDGLKSIIIEQCSIWQQKLTALLLRITDAMINHVYHYIAENSTKITKEPTDLISMQSALQLFERLAAEIPKEEEEFPKILEQYQTLKKYEVPLTAEFKRRLHDIERSWAAYLDLLTARQVTMLEKKEEFKQMLLGDVTKFREDVSSLVHKFNDTGPFTSDWNSKEALSWLTNFRKEVRTLRDKENLLSSQLTLFDISHPESKELTQLEKDITAIEVAWQLTDEWNGTWERYKSGNFWTIETEEMDATANLLLRKLTRLCRELKEKNWEILENTRSRIDKFRRTLPLIADLKNPAMKPRHWTKVKETIGRDFDETSDDFTLEEIAKLQLQNFAEQISEISNAATMELAIETGLQRIRDTWEVMPITMVPYKDKGIYKLKAVDDVMQTLEEHQVQLSSMKSTRFVEPFAQEVDYWERTLSTIGEILEMVLLIQREYVYLENIFTAEDIRKQLPKETDDFDKMTSEWIALTSRMAALGLMLPATHETPGLLDVLNKLNDKLEALQRELEQYLETKRRVFPRFYFISNDDLLEILAHSKRPDLIQPHMKKLFGNIRSLRLTKSFAGKHLADGMYSNEGEYVEFVQPVLLEGAVEYWLCDIETAMRVTLREVLRQCRIELRKMLAKRDRWVKEWPGQPGITSTQIQWTSDCTRTLLHCKLADSKMPLRKLRRKQNQALDKYSQAIRSELSRLDRLKFKAIVVIEIHARDVIERMYRMNCRDVSAFEWLSQLRFYWDKDVNDCVVRQTNTRFLYGYEYLGNTERLVITPLTDRYVSPEDFGKQCYITLTTALHLYRGGSPKGPAGTGKTETVKDLGKALGFNVIVQNCSEGLDYRSMGRLFSGLAQAGAWGCFDEFNRINVEVLSVVAQQILSILTALAQRLAKFIFDGTEIALVHTCGIFITMNPGYAGRTELPDNLKSMFRPISMMVPDSGMIAEINLFGEGFQNTRALAKKVFTLYSLAQQQLSKQCHYDFGLRGIVTLTRYAGKKRRSHPNLPDDEVIILAMRDMNIAKLTSDDLPLFLDIVADLFPNVDVPGVDYGEIISYITNEAIKLKLQPVSMIITKVIELYETKGSRHSTMIVGASGTAKTATWRILQGTMTTMKSDGKPGFNAVHVHPINPKALSLGELYGEYNLSTGEWLDGVISSIMRKTCSEDTVDEKWILFDGPVDTGWIENMNSVMDDNKVLTLINNERITMPDQVSLLFEVQDLAAASPATVSRASMVYNDYRELGWRPYVDSWLQKYEARPEFAKEMNQLFESHVNATLDYKRRNCEEIVAVPELNAVQSLCRLLEVLATPQNGVELGDDPDAYSLVCKIWFFFCMIWSLCATVSEEGRQKMDSFIREIEGSFPLRDTVYEYFVEPRLRAFVSWEEKLSQAWRYPVGTPFYKIIIPTVDTIRYDYIVSSLLSNGSPVLVVGAVGTGKTSTVHSVLECLDDERYAALLVNMSAQTTSNNVQDVIESRMEKRTKGVYIPAGGKTMIVFMDDFNMPMKETYGSQPPLELIRQWIDYGFWYDRQRQARRYIQKIQLTAAMGPPGGGRNVITDRLLAKFNVIGMTFPEEAQIVRIYGTMLNQQLAEFHAEVKGISNDITLASIDLYKHVVQRMLPTPTKMHYLFNLRDISKVFQGLLRSHKDYQYSKQTFLRLWVHESFRVFCDRLIDEKDREWFVTQLNDQLGKHFELTFHNVCPEKRSPVFGSFMNAWDIYEDLSDISAVRRHVEEQMDEYNASPGVVRLNLILFRDAIEHICRIVRVISQPRGNILLIGIGGSGRQSLSRIGSYMCNLATYQVAVTKQYGIAEFREDLKTLYSMAGVENRPTSFLFNDTQVVVEQFLEIVNNMLSTGEVVNLYKSDEMEDIKRKLTKEMAKTGRLSSSEAVYSFLIERTRANMHLILCMSPIGDAFRNRLRQYPALINCTTIDWFLEWPREALLEVGNKFLMNLNLTLTITGENKVEPRQSATAIPLPPLQDRMRDGIAASFSLIHDTVSRFSRRMAVEMKRYNYVTPVNFIELVAGYKEMLAEKRQDLADQANKLHGGLSKIDDTQVKVKEMAAELEVTQQQVHKSTRECEEFLVTIVNQRLDADEAEKAVTSKSHRIAEEQKDCKKLEELARADLATVEPALNEAIKALETLNKKDLAEIKSFAHPPSKVEMVMEAVMILKNSEPTWAEAKRQLGDVNFINTLRDFDKDHISDRTLRTIGKYTSDPEFDPIKVGTVSIAAKSLSMWVIAMEKYGKLYRIVAPKREKLQAALESLRQKEAALEEALQQLRNLHEKLERLQRMYDAKMKEKEDLIRLAELLKLKLERARLLVDGLAEERIRWQNTVASLTESFDRLPGDCLMATGFVSYLGPFVSNYRQELMSIWAKEALDGEIPMSLNLNVKEFLVDPPTIRDWNIQGLPSDEFSTENGIIVTRGSRWPLIIDPQCQAVKWIKNMEAKNSLKVIDFGQANFMKVLEQAIQFGKPVLLENIGETLDPGLNPILQKAFIKSGDQVLIEFNDKLITYNHRFRLFMTTKLPNPHYAPEISTKTTLCNFAIKEEGLEAQLLGIVVRKEKPQLEEQKDNLVLTIASDKRNLKELEDKILHLLSVAGEALLDDPDLLNTLQTSKATSISIQESLVVTEQTEKEIDLAREGYRPSARRASILFFVLNDMSAIDPMYQFSLDAYNALFMLSIEKSPKKAKLSDRIDSLNDYHTYAVYRNTCRGLFEQHKLLFSFHMCVKILDAQGKIIPREYAFLLRGGIVLDRENQPDKPVPWLPDETWDNVTELDKLPGFHGVVSSFEQLPRDWHNWYISTEPEAIPLVGEWEEGCTEFQKMLFIRSCRPDRISFGITTYIARNLSQKFAEPPVLDLKAVLDDSVAQTPLIFILSPGVDPTSALMQLADSQDMVNQLMTLSLGQGQAPIATSMIESGAAEGSWIFLANCHLSLSWMPQLDKIVEMLASSQTLHPKFRLWLSSSPTPQFPISILQAGIKMTTEPPKGLKANMKRLYGLITETQFDQCQEKSKYKKLLFTLVFFHSILLERKKFQQLGWNVVYSFNDSDFEVSENLLQVYLDEYPVTPWESMKYLIAGVCYGGHVTDDWDRRLLMTYVQQYFTEEVLTTPYYRLSSLPTYYVPRDGSLESYRDFIAILPNVDRPEAFGQHPNADITCLITEAAGMFETLMSLQVQLVSVARDEDKEDRVMRLASDILSKMPRTIDYEATERLLGPTRAPLDVVLLQEVGRYNALLTKTRDSLEELQRGIAGLVLMSRELEEIFACIHEGRVPSLWLTAYPSLKLLGAWTRDLINRVEHFANWAQTTHPPLLFWLAAYTFPTGFLTAVLQTSARLWNVSIDSLSWEFTVFSTDESAIIEPPMDGVYIRSIFLEGAGWDVEKEVLVEPAPMQLICSMPVIHFRPVEHIKKKVKDLYSCPCYYYPLRGSDQLQSSFVVAVDLRAGPQGSDFWVKRGTALLLSLAV